MLQHSITADLKQVPAKVRLALESRGVRKSLFAQEVSSILTISRVHAYRKLNGSSELTIPQIEMLEDHLGVNLLPTAANVSLPPVEIPSVPRGVDAILILGDSQVPCTAVLSESSRAPEDDQRYAAYQAKGTWHIEPTEMCRDKSPLFGVTELDLTLLRERIAVVDDERGTANNVRDYFRSTGFAASAFYDSQSATKAIRRQRFDGFLLDWRLGEKTAEGLIKLIRQDHPNVPVIIITAGANDGLANEDEMDALSRKYGVTCYMKPISLKTMRALMVEALQQKE